MAKKTIADTLKVSVSDAIGKVSIKITEASKPKAVVVLAHGAGAGMLHPFMEQFAEALKQKSITTVRYNFPYMENKKGRPDVPAVAEKTVEAVLLKAHQLYPRLPIYASGKSFGGRMSSQFLSKNSPEFVKGIFFLGFPLHSPGAPDIKRAEHLSSVKVPMLFLQGTKDTLADLTLLKPVIKKLKKASIKTFEGADHSFKKGKVVFISELADEVSDWLIVNS